ncbi:MAG: hypothetical protein AAFY82_03580 [Pseudomonadota bacterium]
MRAILFSTICGLALAGCDQLIDSPEPEAETPEVVETANDAQADLQTELQAEPEAVLADRNVAERKTAEINWPQARMDFAAREPSDDGMFAVASAGSPVVPILLPEQNFGVASTGEDALQFRPLADGYFAVQKGDIYDLIINGTDKLVARPEGLGSAVDTELDFEETMTGAQVSFSRYGASYLVEFMCKDPATAAKGSCISEADAVAEVEKLLLAGTR